MKQKVMNVFLVGVKPCCQMEVKLLLGCLLVVAGFLPSQGGGAASGKLPHSFKKACICYFAVSLFLIKYYRKSNDLKNADAL